MCGAIDDKSPIATGLLCRAPTCPPRGLRVEPGKRQIRSRSNTARRVWAGMARVARPTSIGVPFLGWPDVDLLGVTTSLEQDGDRAGCVARVLETVGRSDVPVAAGSDTTLTRGTYWSTADDARHWITPVQPLRSRPGAFVDLLLGNTAKRATVIAIGGLTNPAILELVRPGSLDDVHVDVFITAVTEAASPPA